MADKEYPEHEKLLKVKDRSQSIGEFLYWFRSDGRVLGVIHHHTKNCWEGHGLNRSLECGYNDGDISVLNIPIEKLLAEYFGISPNRIESEKREMLEELRKR